MVELLVNGTMPLHSRSRKCQRARDVNAYDILPDEVIYENFFDIHTDSRLASGMQPNRREV
jgi:hypothetical protein